MLCVAFQFTFFLSFVYSIESSSHQCRNVEIINERCLVDCNSTERFYSDYVNNFSNCQISLYFKTKLKMGYILNSDYFKGNYSNFQIDKISWQYNCIQKIEKEFLLNLFVNNKSKMKQFWSLSITNSYCLYNLDDFIFQSISHLKYLDLSFNHLSHIANNAFYGLELLEILNLNNNNLSNISGKLFVFLKSLKILELSGNSIIHIERVAFQSLTRLELLKLNRNNITFLKKNIFGYFENLHTLDLSFNKLVSFEVDLMGSLCRESIRNLYLNDNKLKTLSFNILDFHNMNPSHVDINLSNNQWICDGELIWMKHCIEYIRIETIKCSIPLKFKDLSLHQVPIKYLKQIQLGIYSNEAKNELSLKDLMIGVIVSIFSVILILSILFLGYRYRWCKYVKICGVAKRLKLVEHDSDEDTQLYMVTKEGDKI